MVEGVKVLGIAEWILISSVFKKLSFGGPVELV